MQWLRLFHAPDDDLAPADYSYVSSVSEGRRIEQMQNIHKKPPVQRVAYPESGVTRGVTMLDPAPADPYGIPDNPFQPPEETQRPGQRRSRAARYAQPQPAPVPAPAPSNVVRTQDGSAFEAPVHVEIPEWLRVAQQNNMPLENRPAPRVQAAPKQEMNAGPVDVLGRPIRNRAAAARAVRQPMQSDAYEQAGYPPELLYAQRQMEAEAAATPVRRRHGAQYASRNPYAPPVQPASRQASQQSYPPPREQMWEQHPAAPREEPGMRRGYMHPVRQPDPYEVEEDDAYEEETERRIRIPWMGIAAFAAVMIAVVLWVMGMQYRNQTQAVLDQRKADQEAIHKAHPVKYEALIAEKAAKYNLHPAFVAAIMFNESSFRPDATSSVDARGLMQLMDDTASWIYDKMDLTSGYDFQDMYDPETNAEYGCWYLNYLSELFYGDPILVAAAFHAGQGEVRNWLNNSSYSADGRTIRLENMIDGPTKQYVTRVLSDYAVYKRLYFGG